MQCSNFGTRTMGCIKTVLLADCSAALLTSSSKSKESSSYSPLLITAPFCSFNAAKRCVNVDVACTVSSPGDSAAWRVAGLAGFGL